MTSILRTAGSQARNFSLIYSQQFTKKLFQRGGNLSKNKSLSMEKTNKNEDFLLRL
jgi:hypothetical protein